MNDMTWLKQNMRTGTVSPISAIAFARVLARHYRWPLEFAVKNVSLHEREIDYSVIVENTGGKFRYFFGSWSLV